MYPLSCPWSRGHTVADQVSDCVTEASVYPVLKLLRAFCSEALTSFCKFSAQLQTQTTASAACRLPSSASLRFTARVPAAPSDLCISLWTEDGSQPSPKDLPEATATRPCVTQQPLGPGLALNSHPIRPPTLGTYHIFIFQNHKKNREAGS